MRTFFIVSGALFCGLIATTPVFSDDSRIKKLDEITITAPQQTTAEEVKPSDIQSKSLYTSDTAQMLQDIPGVSVYSAGGVSSLPVVHGLADDRLRIKIDGMDLISSCPNHMNSALSYIDPTNVGELKVFTGTSPVSLGGDSIGAVIIAETKNPEFAPPGQGSLAKGELGTRYRSNGNSVGGNAGVTLATENFSANYNGSGVKSDNYKAGGDFKNYEATGRPNHSLGRDEVGSSAYEAYNHSLNLALKNNNHLFEAKFGYQDIPKELYPNQRMDMLDNKQERVNLSYKGRFDWGNFEGRVYHEKVKHFMDFGEDKKFNYGALTPPNTSGATYQVNGMPMYTRGETTGVNLKSEIDISKKDVVRVGAEMQIYRLDDWWPPSPDCGVGNCIGGMAPLTFWNINGGKRDRFGIYSEWESHPSERWMTLAGIRGEMVITDTGQVVGYNTSTTPLTFGFLTNMYETSSAGTRADFNNMDRRRIDYNIDWSLMTRYTPSTKATYEFGFSQKTRSPNLYERYSWSRNAMALEMNNFVGDGNGYLGNPDLRSEMAHTVSATADWHSENRNWELKATPYFTYVNDYIDAVQWNRTTNAAANPLVRGTYVIMKYMNQAARIFGADISGKMPLGQTGAGSFDFKALMSYTNGLNTETGQSLYNIMPFNTKAALTHKLGGWDNALEVVGALAKRDTSDVRNEIKTGAYSLFHYRSSYEWKMVRVDLGVENIFDKKYFLPQGGAYTGQGATMSFPGVPWAAVPGPGRSFYAGLTLKF